MRLPMRRLFALALLATPSLAAAQQQIDGPTGPLRSLVTVSDLTGGSAPTGQNLAQYQAGAGTEYDGVARLIMDVGGGFISGCTGSLISSRFVLTAAHCVSSGGGPNIALNGVKATFLEDLGGGNTGLATFQSTNIHVMPGYSGAVVEEEDIALIEFGSDLPSWIPRYSLFNGNPLFQEVEFVGYGLTGNGVTGGVIQTLFDDLFIGGGDLPIRRVVHNSWEVSGIEGVGYYVGPSPAGSILVSDFDGSNPPIFFPGLGTFPATTPAQNNTICQAAGAFGPQYCHAGYGALEGMIGSGDSGGPAFIDVGGQLQIAGVASWGENRCFPVTAGDVAGDGCPPGYNVNGSYFGSWGGHVDVTSGDPYSWILGMTTEQPPVVTPEPVTMTLLGTGLAGIAAARRRRNNAKRENA